MFKSSQNQGMDGGGGSGEINMTPLIDMVFILLIFFLVTAHFKPDEGVEIDRPQAWTSQALPVDGFRVAIAASGDLYVDGRAVNLANVRQQIREWRAEVSDGAVTLATDKGTSAGRLIEVMDAVKLEGVNDVAVVTRSTP
jgi:biopolymer transport protein ExbD